MSDTPERTDEEKEAAQKKKGFASNPANINRNGRPKGSRNKSKLIQAQLNIDSYAEEAVEVLYAIMKGDKDKLGVSQDVPISMRIAAGKEILGKAIANEKEKGAKKPAGAKAAEGSSIPTVSATAK